MLAAIPWVSVFLAAIGAILLAAWVVDRVRNAPGRRDRKRARRRR